MKRLAGLLVVSLLVMAGCGDSGGDSGAPAPATTAPQSQASTTARPSAASLSPARVVEAFKAAGLQAENPRPMTREDYGLAPMKATEALRFLIPSLGPDSGGRVLAFANEADLMQTKAYFDGLGRESAALYSYTFVRANLLVQLNGDLPDAQAKRYDAALQGLK